MIRSRLRGKAGPGASRSRVGRLALTLLVLLAACDAADAPLPGQTVEVVRILPHDSTAYTQGLLLHDGRLYESTGRYGGSTLREVEIETGRVLRSAALPDSLFGEGLARVGDRLVQLTWKEGVALVWSLPDLQRDTTWTQDTHGWGLCHDGQALYMTSGSSILFVRDPETFEVLRTVQITRGGEPVGQVNELECVGDEIYGNVYTESTIVRIDKATGEVVGEIDASTLVPTDLRGDFEAVLNGIAHDPERGTFYLTGKLWPVMYEVRFVPQD